MAEFKKLSEVEQIETASDNATVLVEEGGEIKRVPKKEVGGAGGYVIKLANSYIDDAGLYRFDESYDELYEVLMAGGSVWVDYTDAPESSAAPVSVFGDGGTYDDKNWWYATNFGAEHAQVMVWSLTDVGLFLVDMFALFSGGTPNIQYHNGSHNLEPNESYDE